MKNVILKPNLKILEEKQFGGPPASLDVCKISGCKCNGTGAYCEHTNRQTNRQIERQTFRKI
jgi:hypothetical protein